MINFEHPVKYTDPYNDNYKFYFFIANDGSHHISIDVSYKDLDRGKQMRGWGAVGFSFGLPYKNGIIQWNAYDKSDDRKRVDTISKEAKSFVDKLMKLIAFV